MWLHALKTRGGAQTAQCECGHLIRIMELQSPPTKKKSGRIVIVQESCGKISHTDQRFVTSRVCRDLR